MMSTELEGIQSSTSKPQKKRKDHDVIKKTKKRKRISHENDDSPAPVKRHYSKRPSSPEATNVSAGPFTSPEDSPFYEQTYSLYLPLSPISYRHPLQGLCAEHLSPLILSYYPPFQGVILSYCNARLSAGPIANPEIESLGPILAKSVDEYAVSFVWVTADFLIFSPHRHNHIEGWVNLQNEGNLGLVCWNFFNVSIERKRLPRGWIWVPYGRAIQATRKHKANKVRLGSGYEAVEEEVHRNVDHPGDGHFADENGKKIEGLVRFKVTNVETSRSADRENGFISIEGTMLNEQEEQQQQDNVEKRKKGLKHPKQRSDRDRLMHGSLANGSQNGVLDKLSEVNRNG